MVREGDWKLVVATDTGAPTMLFNLRDDPYELHNLVDDAGYVESQSALLERIDTWRGSYP